MKIKIIFFLFTLLGSLCLKGQDTTYSNSVGIGAGFLFYKNMAILNNRNIPGPKNVKYLTFNYDHGRNKYILSTVLSFGVNTTKSDLYRLEIMELGGAFKYKLFNKHNRIYPDLMVGTKICFSLTNMAFNALDTTYVKGSSIINSSRCSLNPFLQFKLYHIARHPIFIYFGYNYTVFNEPWTNKKFDYNSHITDKFRCFNLGVEFQIISSKGYDFKGNKALRKYLKESHKRND